VRAPLAARPRPVPARSPATSPRWASPSCCSRSR
jgi:hypothetical protein